MNTGDSILRRNRDWLDKGLIDIHASIEIPKGERHPRFAQVPDLESFAKSDREKKILRNVSRFPARRAKFFPASRRAERPRANSHRRDAENAR